MVNEERSSGKWTLKKFLWVAILGPLIVIFGLYILYPESTIKRIKVPGLFEAEFERKLIPQEKIEDIPTTERVQLQEELNNKLLQAETKINEAVPQTQENFYLPKISGVWQTADGISYTIQQRGNMVAIQENTIYGITLVGQGTINEQGIDINYNTILGTTGALTLELSENERQLEGSFKDAVTGVSGLVILFR